MFSRDAAAESSEQKFSSIFRASHRDGTITCECTSHPHTRQPNVFLCMQGHALERRYGLGQDCDHIQACVCARLSACPAPARQCGNVHRTSAARSYVSSPHTRHLRTCVCVCVRARARTRACACKRGVGGGGWRESRYVIERAQTVHGLSLASPIQSIVAQSAINIAHLVFQDAYIAP